MRPATPRSKPSLPGRQVRRRTLTAIRRRARKRRAAEALLVIAELSRAFSFVG